MSAPTPETIGLPTSRFRVDESGCWLWTGAHKKEGYGFVAATVERDGQQVRTTKPAHRISYEATYGPIPKGLHIDHLCRVPACVNPAHLEAVTQRENLLRGIGPAAVNAVKTHCIRDHEFTPENTYTYYRNGLPKRRCRKCSAANETARRLMEAAA